MAVKDAAACQRALIAKVAQSLGPSCTSHETHISLVLVAGGFAYKFKKAVRFDFLDFSSLRKRRYYCEEELRLNRHFAPGIYLDVIAITGDPEHPVIGSEGTPFEYAVRMRAFDQASLWSERVRQARLTGGEVDALAEALARIHAQAARAPADSPWCTPAALQAIADETLNLILASLPAGAGHSDAEWLRQWEAAQRIVLHEAFMRRRADGCIRECHGDLHCGNILTIDGIVEAFDCIEFNDSLRWIDVMNDIAFTCMDLRSKGLPRFAARLLNRYLESTGDYEGLRVFGYYEAHRALIRCKVALLSAAQHGGDTANGKQAQGEALEYLSLARRRLSRKAPAILITHGFSGSGKSTLARAAVETLDAIQLRSDVERKRLHGIADLQRGRDDIYSQDATGKVYARLAALARSVVEAGWSAVVDASFLERKWRDMFALLAKEMDVRFVILDARADVEEMRRRITQREHAQTDASDAGLAVLERQLSRHDVFSEEEMPQVLTVDTGKLDPENLRAWLAGI